MGQNSMRRCWRILFLLVPLLLGTVQGLLLAEETNPKSLPPAANTQVDFYRDIEPLLKEKCQSCHGSAQQMSGLRLDSREASLAGGNSGVVD